MTWAAPIFFALTLMGGLTSHRALDRPFDQVAPWRLLPESVTGAASGVGLTGMVATILLAAASVIVRYRRADQAVRRQLKSVALSGVL